MVENYLLHWASTKLNPEQVEALLPHLTASEKMRWNELTGIRADRYISGRLGARMVSSEMLGSPWQEMIPVAHCSECGMDHGAIAIEGTDITVSLSSAGDALIAAASRGVRIGVDIEKGSLGDRRTVGMRAGQVELSLGQWCEYEALAKATGQGLVLDIEDVKEFESTFTVEPACEINGLVLAVAWG